MTGGSKRGDHRKRAPKKVYATSHFPERGGREAEENVFAKKGKASVEKVKDRKFLREKRGGRDNGNSSLKKLMIEAHKGGVREVSCFLREEAVGKKSAGSMSGEGLRKILAEELTR